MEAWPGVGGGGINTFKIAGGDPAGLGVVPGGVKFHRDPGEPFMADSILISISVPVLRRFFVYPYTVVIRADRATGAAEPVCLVVSLSDRTVGGGFRYRSNGGR